MVLGDVDASWALVRELASTSNVPKFLNSLSINYFSRYRKVITPFSVVCGL